MFILLCQNAFRNIFLVNICWIDRRTIETQAITFLLTEGVLYTPVSYGSLDGGRRLPHFQRTEKTREICLVGLGTAPQGMIDLMNRRCEDNF